LCVCDECAVRFRYERQYVGIGEFTGLLLDTVRACEVKREVFGCVVRGEGIAKCLRGEFGQRCSVGRSGAS
jgi:hypothetical protein